VNAKEKNNGYSDVPHPKENRSNLRALELGGIGEDRFLSLGRDSARRLDREAQDLLGIPSCLLMENAGRGVAEVAQELGANQKVLILAGKGNNGGDGLSAARFLAPRVVVALLGPLDSKKVPDAHCMLSILEAADIEVHVGCNSEELTRLARSCDLLVDGLFGIGLDRPPQGLAREWIPWMNDSGLPILAVDVPSGLDADTGQAFEPCVHAVKTLTFARPKKGLFLRDGPKQSGRVQVASIGIPEPWVQAFEAQ
jgi:NAD(P)H-hydrate epimerase